MADRARIALARADSCSSPRDRFHLEAVSFRAAKDTARRHGSLKRLSIKYVRMLQLMKSYVIHDMA